MVNELIIVVIGSNRGVSKGIVELLAKQQHLSRSLTIYATSRSGINIDLQALASNEIRYKRLDITQNSSIETFFQGVLEEHAVIDDLINNAAVSNNYHETPDFAAETIKASWWDESYVHSVSILAESRSRITNCKCDQGTQSIEHV